MCHCTMIVYNNHVSIHTNNPHCCFNPTPPPSPSPVPPFPRSHPPLQDFCFYQLRTVKQLGYVAFCFQGNYGGIGSFQVVVQSQEYNASYVLREIDQFLEDFGNSTIANMSTTDLEMKKKLYANSLKQKSKTLSEESDRLWEEIATGTQQFDYNSQLLNTLSSITAQDVEQFYTSHITNSSQYRKLVLSVYGKDKEVDFSSDFSYCMDYDKIDQTAEQYPTPNTQCSMS